MAYLTSLGLGRHEIVIILENIEDFDSLNQTIIATCSVYLPVILCVKASALFLYRRLFPSKRFHIICYIVLAFTTLYALAAILTLTISCLPPNPPTAEEPIAQLKCPNYYIINALLVILITNVVLDAIVLCLPLPLIWQLHTTLRRKLQLTFVFTLGSFIFVVSILRVIAVKELNPLDDNWDSTDVQLWSIAESAVSILTVSLPVMQPALRRVVYKEDGSSRFSSLRSRSSGGSSSGPKKNSGGSGKPISLLTFGRTGMKPGRKPRGLDVTTVRTITQVDSNPDGGSVTKLVSEEDGASYNMGTSMEAPGGTRQV